MEEEILKKTKELSDQLKDYMQSQKEATFKDIVSFIIRTVKSCSLGRGIRC